MDNLYDVIVIGAGPAGLTAAMYAARSGLKTALFEAKVPGGQLNSVVTLENYPGFPQGISGPELTEKFMEQASKFGAELIYQNVDSVKKEGSIFKVISSGSEYSSKTVIAATGLSQTLGIPGEEAYLGKGVSYCATCDAPLYRRLDTAIIGGSDYAVEESLKLASFAKNVYIINTAKELNISDKLKEILTKKENVTVINTTKLIEIYGENSLVTGIKVQNLLNNKVDNIKLDGVFIYLGKKVPSTKFLDDLVKRDEKGFIKVDGNCMTTVDGLFAIGDVRSANPHQVGAAVGDAVICAVFVKKYTLTK